MHSHRGTYSAMSVHVQPHNEQKKISWGGMQAVLQQKRFSVLFMECDAQGMVPEMLAALGMSNI